jgi:hypothetical protein
MVEKDEPVRDPAREIDPGIARAHRQTSVRLGK